MNVSGGGGNMDLDGEARQFLNFLLHHNPNRLVFDYPMSGTRWWHMIEALHKLSIIE